MEKIFRDTSAVIKGIALSKLLLTVLAVTYLTVPVVIFILGWIRLVFGIPAAVLTISGAVYLIYALSLSLIHI